MSRTTFSILFYLKRSKLNKEGEAPNYMRITINGERSETSIKRSINPARWNTAKVIARSLSEVEKDLNHYLKQITNQIYLKQQELEGRNRIVTSRTLMNAYLNKDDDRRTILKVFDEHNDKLFKLIGRGVASNTHKRYVTSRDHIERFLRDKFKMTDYISMI